MPQPASAASRSRRRAKGASRLDPLDRLMTGCVGAGVLLLLLPQALSRLPGQAGLAGLQRYGWGLLVLGLGLLALRLLRRSAGKAPTAVQPSKVAPLHSTRPGPPPGAAPAPAPAVHSTLAAPDASADAAARPVTSDAPPPRPTAWGPEVFRVIEWRRFEALVETLFAQAGFVTRTQSHGADGGVDIWLHSRNQPDGAPVSIVQCKHWSDRKPVGVDKIRELRGVMAAHNIRRGQFACTARYTDAAREFAKDNQINLLDGTALLDLIAKRTPDQQQALLDVALEGEYWKPTCVNCGVKMVFRVPRQEGKGFWGCVNYPKCRATMNIRGE